MILFLNFLVIISAVKATVPSDWAIELEVSKPAFDPQLYEDALDPELCRVHLDYIQQNTLLRLQFLDAGMRLPRGITQFNFLDLGNYDQCIGIEQDIGSSVIEGKYCSIQGPLRNNFNNIAAAMEWSDFDKNILNEENLDRIKAMQNMQKKIQEITSMNNISKTTPGLPVTPVYTMAVCVPKTCTTQEGIRGLIFNLTLIGFQYEEQFCRFKDDKPWVPADYVAMKLVFSFNLNNQSIFSAIFSFIGLLTIISTGYDLWQIFFMKTDSKSINAVYRSFSVYTNTKRLTTFNSNPNNLNCVDGIRAISMFWIVVGHTYALLPPFINNLDVYEWLYSLKAMWIIAAPYSVDTFFFLSGMLLVYTTVGKMSGKSLLKKLHLFYMNRLLRMFPLLATIVLLQASIFHRIADGPNWQSVAANVNSCRTYWWSTLLHIQNLVNVTNLCLGHTWYLAIDIHCYIISPVVLYWLLGGKRKQACVALICAILISLTAAATYSFIHQFQGWVIGNVRGDENPLYHFNYYYFTLPRAPSFFVGMLVGYILNIWKGKTPEIPRIVSMLLWVLSGGTMLTLAYIPHLIMDPEWDLWIVDDLVNSFARPLWAVCVGWIVFACQYGYGGLYGTFWARVRLALFYVLLISSHLLDCFGPVNWFLSLDIWKLPSRISFALYLFHYQFQFLINGMNRVTLIFYSDFFALYEFFAQVTISYGVAFALTLIIDSPISVLIKKLLGEGPKKSPVQKDLIPDKY